MHGLLFVSSFLLGCVNAGTVVWDGRFNDYTTNADLEKWSWSNQVGSYQYYIHGAGAVSNYVNFSPSYKNPADSASKQGVKITVNPKALWNSDMWRTELIPQTKANLGTGRLYYHFSVKKSGTNPPNPGYEHQVNFFESHFTELKFGNPGTPDNNLRWFVGGQSKWNVDWVADVWHNFAYDIDFSAKTVALWHSTGSGALVKVGDAVAASTSTNSADWHLGVLRLPNRSGGTNDQAAEDWYFSGVYVESGSLTTAVTNGGAAAVSAAVALPPSVPRYSIATGMPTNIPSRNATSAVATATTFSTRTTYTASATGGLVGTGTGTPSTGGLAVKWGQCGGKGWKGATACVAGATCTKSNEYYSQCL